MPHRYTTAAKPAPAAHQRMLRQAHPAAADSSEPPRSHQRYLAGRRLGSSSALRIPLRPFLSRQLEVLGAMVNAGAVQPASTRHAAPSWTHGWPLESGRWRGGG